MYSDKMLLMNLKVLGHHVPENCGDYLKKAKEMSSMFGDSFVDDFNEKVSQVEKECKDISGRAK